MRTRMSRTWLIAVAVAALLAVPGGAQKQKTGGGKRPGPSSTACMTQAQAASALASALGGALCVPPLAFSGTGFNGTLCGPGSCDCKVAVDPRSLRFDADGGSATVELAAADGTLPLSVAASGFGSLSCGVAYSQASAKASVAFSTQSGRQKGALKLLAAARVQAASSLAVAVQGCGLTSSLLDSLKGFVDPLLEDSVGKEAAALIDARLDGYLAQHPVELCAP